MEGRNQSQGDPGERNCPRFFKGKSSKKPGGGGKKTRSPKFQPIKLPRGQTKKKGEIGGGQSAEHVEKSNEKSPRTNKKAKWVGWLQQWGVRSRVEKKKKKQMRQ